MSTVSIRPIRRGDRAGIERLLSRASEFTPVEIGCALELVDGSIERGNNDEDYAVFCAESPENSIIGFVCYGKTPLTQATYNLYWIAIDPSNRRGGVGRNILRYLENILNAKGARLLVAETSSLSAYAQARSFYAKEGFLEEACIRDFYAPGDDLLIYCKRLQQGGGIR
jgi:ribosomal protein S18 acetylase RimI-like enzyme